MAIDDKANASALKRTLVGKSKALPLKPSILKIVVGKEETEFCIHESLLTGRSKFFRKAVQKGWKEAEDKLVKFPNEESSVFSLYAQLVYTGCIPAIDEQENRYLSGNDTGEKKCNNTEACDAEYEALSGLYVLVEMLQDTEAKNSTVDALIGKIRAECEILDGPPEGCLPRGKAISILYNNTTGPCPGRQVIVDAYSGLPNGAGLREAGDSSQLPRDFMFSLADRQVSGRIGDFPLKDVDCGRYHEKEGEVWKPAY